MTSHLWAAEYVLPGHPDKLCDAIADALVAEASRREKRALCGVEVAVHRSAVFVTGRIACAGAQDIDIEGIVRQVYRDAGYGEDWYPNPADLEIKCDLCLGALQDGESAFRSVSDDQCIVTGYAVDLPGTNYLPPDHWITYRLARRLECLRQTQPNLRLGPDGKLIVLYDPEHNCVNAFSASVQQSIRSDEVALRRAILQLLASEFTEVAKAIPGFNTRLPDPVSINGAGNFAVGGPEGDNGLSGKKLVVDAYGPRVAIGGGALSGKDLFKADRAGAILARRIAKAVVKSGTARECRATVAIFPGDTSFKLVNLLGDNPTQLDANRWAALFDLSLESGGETYTADLIDCARYGHFTNPTRPWETVRFEN